MKDLLLKSSGTLLFGFLALIFTGCKDQRSANDDYRETYPPAGGSEQRTNESYDSSDTLYPNEGIDESQENNQSGNQNSGSVPDDGKGSNPSTPDDRSTGN